MSIADKLTQIAENIPKVFKSGKQAEHDAFWDAFQGATRRRWSSAFIDASWNDVTFYPKYDLMISGDASALFRYSGITDLEDRLNECGVTLDTSECTSLNCAFGESKTLTVIPTLDLRKCTASNSTTGVFSGCISLKTIRKLIVNETTLFPSTFMNCPMLENIVFEGVIGESIDLSSSTKLTRASIEGIVNHLSNGAEGKTLTLSETAVDTAFSGGLCAEDFETPTEDGSNTVDWFDLYLAKGNWTITLV